MVDQDGRRSVVKSERRISKASRRRTWRERGRIDSLLDRLELVAILGPDGKVAYDAVVIGDGGTVFDAGTTNEVATIAQGHVESSKPKLAKVLQRVVFARGK